MINSEENMDSAQGYHEDCIKRLEQVEQKLDKKVDEESLKQMIVTYMKEIQDTQAGTSNSAENKKSNETVTLEQNVKKTEREMRNGTNKKTTSKTWAEIVEQEGSPEEQEGSSDESFTDAEETTVSSSHGDKQGKQENEVHSGNHGNVKKKSQTNVKNMGTNISHSRDSSHNSTQNANKKQEVTEEVSSKGERAETWTEVPKRRQISGNQGNRDLNIVIHRAPESNKSTQEGRRQDDTEMFEMLCEQMNMETSIKITNMFRLGGRPAEDKIRPIKVSFQTKENKGMFMRSLAELRNMEEPFRSLSINDDLTLEEREENRKLVIEAKKLTEEDDGDFIFKVRGPPWDRRIVRLKRNE